jgi:hypothetical protein
MTESYVAAVLETGAAQLDRDGLREDGRPVETYRRLGLEEALARL